MARQPTAARKEIATGPLAAISDHTSLTALAGCGKRSHLCTNMQNIDAQISVLKDAADPWARLAILIGGSAALWAGLGWVALRILKMG